MGILTRDSIRQALKGGITAEQMIGYLKQHAHPQMFESESGLALPPTVVDQIKLWELERNRLVYSDGVLYSQFLSQVRNPYQHLRGQLHQVNFFIFAFLVQAYLKYYILSICKLFFVVTVTVKDIYYIIKSSYLKNPKVVTSVIFLKLLFLN